MKPPAHWIKLAASMLLVVAFVLPLSRCAETPPPKGAGTPQAAQQRADSPKTYRYYYAWTDIESSQPWGWLFLLVFFWPLAFFGYEHFGRSAGAKRALLWVQPALALGSGYWLYLRTFLRELWFGGYIAYIALALILLASVVQLVGLFRSGGPRPTPEP